MSAELQCNQSLNVRKSILWVQLINIGYYAYINL